MCFFLFLHILLFLRLLVSSNNNLSTYKSSYSLSPLFVYIFLKNILTLCLFQLILLSFLSPSLLSTIHLSYSILSFVCIVPLKFYTMSLFYFLQFHAFHCGHSIRFFQCKNFTNRILFWYKILIFCIRF